MKKFLFLLALTCANIYAMDSDASYENIPEYESSEENLRSEINNLLELRHKLAVVKYTLKEEITNIKNSTTENCLYIWPNQTREQMNLLIEAQKESITHTFDAIKHKHPEIENMKEQILKLEEKNYNLILLYEQWKNLEEEETKDLFTLLGQLKLYKMRRIALSKQIDTISCEVYPTEASLAKTAEELINSFNSIKCKSTRINVLKQKALETSKKEFNSTITREQCEQQQELLKQQKAFLEQAQS